ncbi:MAG: DUF2877 domain-containing protein, partial [Bacillota bacterium]|nr:DUF2877 domain-containing protein [Bacillota bacterium]
IGIKKIPKHLIDKIDGALVKVEDYNKGSYYKSQTAYLFLTFQTNLNALSISIAADDLNFIRSRDFQLRINEETEIVNLTLEKNKALAGSIEEKIRLLNPDVGIFAKREKMLEVLPQLEERIKTRGLASLVGLGLGLTPSGDDFLAGLMAVERALGLSLVDEDLNLDNTNKISGEFLKYSQHGIFSEDIIKLFNFGPTYVNEILKSGHTSGADTLFGIYYGLVKSKLLNK